MPRLTAQLIHACICHGMTSLRDRAISKIRMHQLLSFAAGHAHALPTFPQLLRSMFTELLQSRIQASQARTFEAFEELSKKLLQSECGTGSTRLWVCFFKTLDVNIALWDCTKARLLSLCLIPPVGCEGVVALVGDHASLTGSPQRW